MAAFRRILLAVFLEMAMHLSTELCEGQQGMCVQAAAAVADMLKVQPLQSASPPSSLLHPCPHGCSPHSFHLVLLLQESQAPPYFMQELGSLEAASSAVTLDNHCSMAAHQHGFPGHRKSL